MIIASTVDSPLGPLRMKGENGVLTGLWFIGEQHEEIPHPQETWIESPADPVFLALQTWLTGYFHQPEAKLWPPPIPLLPQGTPFQQEVWDLLQQIPYGQVTTYGEIARVLAGRRGGRVMAAQAVGMAVGRNPISILIPCHRVIGTGGKLTGYAGGLGRKQALLEIEGLKVASERILAAGRVDHLFGG